MTGDDRAYRISMVTRKITPIHLVGNQDFWLDPFLPWHAAGVGDRTRRFGLFRRRLPISSLEHDFAHIAFQASPLQ
jgi:hypothetical protein